MSGRQAGEDVRALIRIGVFEAFVIAAVAAVWLYTNNMVYLIGGLVGSQILVLPMLVRWAKARREAQGRDIRSDGGQ